MFARGRQESSWSAKKECLKYSPNAVCKREYFGELGYAYGVYENKKDVTAIAIRPSAEKAWLEALRIFEMRNKK